MHHYDLSQHLKIDQNVRKIVLVGNPNVGKSVVFNALTGLYVDVSNYPGTTLEISYGMFAKNVVIDTPGIYGVSSFNDEEIVARDVVLTADLIINVVDAVHLERDLFLTQQIIDMKIPVIVVLNMVDEAKRQGIRIDIDLLSDLLGVPVIPTVAVSNQGIDILKKSLDTARTGNIDFELQKQLNELLNRVGNQAEALLVLENDPHIAVRHGLTPINMREEIYLKRRQRVNDVIGHVISEATEQVGSSVKLGRLMLQPSTGIPILALFLWLTYQFVGVFIAQTVVGITEETIMQGYYEPFIKYLIGQFISDNSLLGNLLVGEFGVLTMTATYVLGLLLPLVLGFYFILSTMEDSGYLPRLAALVDRVLMTVGLNGRGIIPIILGFGCVTMATITTRLLASDRERKIATFLLAMTIPCSAQLAVIVGMLAGLGAKYMIMYVIVIFLILVITGTILNKIIPGQSTDLFIDLPPLRIPRLNNVFKKTWTKSMMFLKEATPIFALGSIIISLLQTSGLLDVIQNAVSPITVGWLQLPKEAANAFIMGFVRRDFGAAGLYNLNLGPLQTMVALITITIFVPCIASVMVIFKERGKKEALIIWPSIMALAFLIGGIISQLII